MNLKDFSQFLYREKPKCFSLNGLNFDLNVSDFTQRTTAERIVFCKTYDMILEYIKLYESAPFRNVLNFGFHRGGCVLFFASAFEQVEKVVGIDITEYDPAIIKVINDHELSDKIKLHFSTSQDSSNVVDIIIDDLNEMPDLIIDDCSHEYELTKRSFELTFPLLKPGGRYIIEDWCWSHQPACQPEGSWNGGKPGLSNLIFEIVALLGSQRYTHPGWIKSINFPNNAMCVIEKGDLEITNPFSIDSNILNRNRIIIPIEMLYDTIESLEAENCMLNKQIESLHNSTSWNITRPFRALVQVSKRFKEENSAARKKDKK